MTPDYYRIQELLQGRLPRCSPAALHGAITGLLTSGATDIDEEDVALLLDCEFAPVVAQLVERLIETTRAQLQEQDFSFQPVLPLDDTALAARVSALGHWCESFTNGFSAGFVLGESALGAEGREALTDIAQLASLVDEPADDMEDQEEDYMELVEYVRMATVTLYQQLIDSAAQPVAARRAPDSGDNVLH